MVDFFKTWYELRIEFLIMALWFMAPPVLIWLTEKE